MDIQNAAVIIGIDQEVYAGILRALLADDTPGIMPLNGDRTLRFDSVDLGFIDEPQQRLFIAYQGVVDDPNGATTVFIQCQITPAVFRPDIPNGMPDLGPQIGFDRKAISVTPNTFEDELVPQMTLFFDGLLTALSFPVFENIMQDLVPASYSTLGITLPSSWPADFVAVGQGTTEEVDIGNVPGSTDLQERGRTTLTTVSAFHAILALPGNTATFGEDRSIVPRGSGMHVVFSKPAMDLILAARAQEQINEEIEGAKITDLSIAMNDLGVGVNGRATRDGAEITWNGTALLSWQRFKFFAPGSTPVRIRALPGGGRLQTYTGNIHTDIDLPWWVNFLRVFSIVIGPIGWILKSAVLDPIIEDQIGDVPDLVEAGVGEQVSSGFNRMLENVGALGTGTVPSQLYVQNLWVDDAALVLNYIFMAGVNPIPLLNHTHDYFSANGASGESVGLLEFHSGHVLHPSEAGTLMLQGILQSEGYHGVNADYGNYVRSNPNETTEDNLVDPENIET